MALATPYCTLLDLADELKNNEAIVGDDDYDADSLTRHEAAVNRASRMAEEWCHRDWTIHDHTGTPLTVQEKWVVADSIFLPWPIQSVTALTIDGETIDTEDYRVEGRYELRYVDCFPDFPFDTDTFIQITGTLGYTHADLTTVPDDEDFPAGLRRAVTLIAAAISGDYHKEMMPREGGAPQQVLVTDIPKEAKMLLRKYRRRFF